MLLDALCGQLSSTPSAPRNSDDHVAPILARAPQRAEVIDRRLVQPNDHVALVGRTGGPRLRVSRQSRFDRRVGFGGDRNAYPGTGTQRGLPPHVCRVSDAPVMI